jgi:ubiquinone/menaquinone biosynthesis C-methylase UbiE
MANDKGYSLSATVYDLIYEWKDYAREANLLRWIIAANKKSAGKALLDVACGTGKHLAELKRDYTVEGMDLSEDLLAVAKQRLPEAPLHHGDMTNFSLGKQFDVITCLFSAIGHVLTVENLNKTLRCMSAHTLQGGVVIVESWFTPEQYHPGTAHASFVNKPEIKIARMNVSEQRGNVSVFDMHHLVADASGVRHFVEHLELAMFARDEYVNAFDQAGLDVTIDETGLMGRVLYIGVKR